MNSAGFKLKKENGQIRLNFLLPEALREVFRVSFYGRGPLLDMAEGKPSVIWKNLTGAIKQGKALVAPYQKHGVTVVGARAGNALPARPEADGVYLDKQSDACASLRFADCAPIVITYAGADPWMLILHSGYAGTVKNITGTALAEILKRKAIFDSAKIYAWIAPAICPECYTRRLEDEAAQMGMAVFAPDNFAVRGSFVRFDIKKEIKRKICEQGVLRENIYTSELCTHCDRDKFYSYRAGDENNRNFLLAVNTTNAAY